MLCNSILLEKVVLVESIFLGERLRTVNKIKHAWWIEYYIIKAIIITLTIPTLKTFCPSERKILDGLLCCAVEDFNFLFLEGVHGMYIGVLL